MKKSTEESKNVDEINPVHAVIRVNYALEFLKLFCDDGSGEGVPVEVSILPDFVIDFDQETLEKKVNNKKNPKLKEKPINEIGGRAGRITRDLAFLRYRNDGTFRINFFCKTDEVGLALLRKKLQKEMEDKYHPIDLSFVHQGSLARATLRKGQEIIDASPAYAEHELSMNDLKIKGFDRIQRSTITMITSIRTPDFENIFRGICSTMGEKAVIIDTARTSEKEDWKKFFEIVRPDGRRSPIRKRIAAIIFENSKEKEEIQKAYEYLKAREGSPFKDKTKLSPDRFAIDLQKWLDIPILILEDRYVCWLDKDKKFVVPLPKNVDIRKIPDSPETFKAGFLLATAVKRALETWNEDHKQDNKKCINFWGIGGISIENTLFYASLLCGAWAEEKELDKHPDRDTLLRFASEAKFHQLSQHEGLAAVYPSPPEENFLKLRSNQLYHKLHTDRNNMDLEDQLYLIDGIGYLDSNSIDDKIKDEIFEIINFPTLALKETKNRCKELDKTAEDIPTSIAVIKALKNLNNHNGEERIIPSLLERAMVKDKEKGERRVVLVDFDSTLMDSANVRRLALFPALKELVPLFSKNFNEPPQSVKDKIEQKELIEACVDFYESLVYDRWPLYLYLGIDDFRQKWNRAASYGVFLVLLICMANSKDNITKDAFDEAYLSKVNKQKKSCEDKLRTLKVNSKEWKDTKRRLEEIEMLEKDKNEKISLLRSKIEGLLEMEIESVKKISDLWELLDKIDPETPLKRDPENTKKESVEEIINRLRMNEYLKESFVEDARKIQIKCSWEVTSARQKFEEVKFEPYKESFDFINMLINVGGFDVYIATEGVQETQLFKIRQTGLAEKISDQKVLSTGLVSTPEEDLQVLERLYDENKNNSCDKEIELRECKAQQEVIKKSPDTGYPLKKEIDEYLGKRLEDYNKKRNKIEREKEELEEDKKMIENFHEIYKKFGRKEMKAFYALIAHAIDAEREKPLELLRSFDNIELYKGERSIGERSPLKVVMIGDKHINDIKPLIELFNGGAIDSERIKKRNILTIRIRTEKYRDKPEYGEDDYWPDYVVHTLEEAKYILLEEKTWDTVNYMPYPVILDFPIYDKNKCKNRWDMLVWGFKQEQQHFAVTLARQLVEENCADSKTAKVLLEFLKEQLDALTTLLSSTSSEDNFKEYNSPLRIATQVATHLLRMKEQEGDTYNKLCKELEDNFDHTFEYLSRLYKELVFAEPHKANSITNLQCLIVEGLCNLEAMDKIEVLRRNRSGLGIDTSRSLNDCHKRLNRLTNVKKRKNNE